MTKKKHLVEEPEVVVQEIVTHYYKKGNCLIVTSDTLEGCEELTKEQYDHEKELKAQARAERELARKNSPKAQISRLKAELAATDYQAIKHSEGWISDEDYAEIKAARQALRDQINELEGELE